MGDQPLTKAPARHNQQDESKEFFAIVYKAEDGHEYSIIVNEQWMDFAEDTVMIPPPTLMKKSTWLDRVEPDPKTWSERDIIIRWGPYVYDDARKVSKALSDGESDPEKCLNATTKRSRTKKVRKEPGEKTSSDTESSDSQEHSSDEDKPPQKWPRKTLSKASSGVISTPLIPRLNTTKSKTNDATARDDGNILNNLHNSLTAEPNPVPSTSNGRTTNASDSQLILRELQNTRLLVVKEFQNLRAEQRVQRRDQADAAVDNSLPQFPLKSRAEIVNFERQLEDQRIMDALQTRLKMYAGEGVSEYVLNILDYVLTEEMIESYSWSGNKRSHKNKKRFKSTMIKKALTETILSSFGTVAQIEKSIKSHLQHAKERHAHRKKAREAEQELRGPLQNASR